ncbi:MAG: NAD-dependent epimerase/dehydratase family protein [Actinobacteria bacterium]|nr:NAD-dependent epimerase/dehydratase family protein [Actinomycetota bacterium]
MSPARTAVGDVADVAAGIKTSVWLSNGSAGLYPRVARLFAASDRLGLVESGQFETLVWLAAADADVLAEPAQVAPSGLSAALTESHDLSHHLQHVVLVSSAMVYGAWANNPVPLTEDSLLRPDVEFSFARQLGAAEQLVDEWRRQRPGRTVTVLRPVVAMAFDGTSRLASALAAGMGQRAGTADPPSQFLHLDDLARAVLLAAEQRLDGVFNVAPDGWIAGERVRALAGAVPRLKLPDRVNEVVGNLRWRFERGPIPPGLRSYTRSPWLVANDRLKAAGWRPNVTNEQAYVEGTEAKWWTMVSPKRRQEMTLAGLALAILVGLVLIVRAARRASATRQP